MLTTETEEFRRALHLAKLMPLGRHSEAKKAAIRKWCDAIKKALANRADK